MEKMKPKVKRMFSVVLTMFLIFNLIGDINLEVYAADSKVESAISWAIGIANDDSHGYSQSVRWGPHYDCSSFVYSAFCQAGFNLPGSGTRYTQTMVNDFTKAGFIWIPWSQIGNMSNLRRGDILLNNSSNSSKQHTEIYLGNGQNVGAHSPSKGISVSGYYNHPWLGVLRYGSSSAPSNPQISKNQYWYDLQDRIEVTAYADGATSYFMSMFKDGNKIISQGVDGGKFSMAASAYGKGDYSAYFSCTNSAGTVDTKWIDFSVVGEPGYSNVWVSDYWYDLSDTVSITVDTICAKGQVIGIDKNGVERVVTESTEPTYKIAASKLGVGKYSAYFSVYNGSGGEDTKRVEFEIVNAPKEGAIISSAKESYGLDDEVQIAVEVLCSKYQWIGIDKEGTGRVITEKVTNGKYQLPASKLGKGKYSAYFSVCNDSGGYDTERIEFLIEDKAATGQIGDNNSDGKDNPDNKDNLDDKDNPDKGQTDIDEGTDPDKDKTDIDEGKNPNEENDSEEDDKDLEEEETPDTDDGQEPNGLEVGDIVEDARSGDEYEIISMDGNMICAEYLESANPKAAIIKIPGTIKTEAGTECKVTSISKCAFKNNRKLKKVVIGDNVTVIGTKAFSGCRNLTSIVMGKNIAVIGANAFSSCVKLTGLTVPSKVTKIGSNAFSGCKKLKKLDIKSRKLNARGVNKKAFRGIPVKAVIQVPRDKQNIYKKLLCQRGLSKKNKIR